MNAPGIKLGQIVWAEIADANQNRKSRPTIVVTPTKLISATSTLEVVAITSTLPQPLPEDYILLPWHGQGHPRTGLKRKCAAVPSWVARILPSDIQSVAGVVPDRLLLEILKRIQSMQSPDTGVVDDNDT
jgi:mRNA-degrading endonuclease toxin of MazEF toxin-antitoxin module